MVIPADSTLAAIRKKVRRLTASASEASLSTDDIDQYVNTYYSQDFPYSVKLDQMRSVYTFYTAPNIDRYPLNVNYNMGVRGPFYVDGIQGNFFKDRNQFFNMFPMWPTQFQRPGGDGTQTSFSFTIGAIPFLRGSVTIGAVDVFGATIRISDNGNGILLSNQPNPVVSQPTALENVPGMKNLNTANPGDEVQTIVGTVNYVIGTFAFTLPVAVASGTLINVFVSQYQTGRPYTMLFWNNEFIIRPVPKLVHKLEIETYLTPVQFMNATDSPLLNQLWQLIAIGAAIKVLEDRQDIEGLKNLSLLFDRQEALTLERQGVEEIGQRNATIFSSAQQTQGWNNTGQGWF